MHLLYYSTDSRVLLIIDNYTLHSIVACMNQEQLRMKLAECNPTAAPCGVQHGLGGQCANAETHFWCVHGSLVTLLCRVGSQLRTRLGEEQFQADLKLLQHADVSAITADTKAHSVHTGRHFYARSDDALAAAHAQAEQGDRHAVATAYARNLQTQMFQPLIEMRERYLKLLGA